MEHKSIIAVKTGKKRLHFQNPNVQNKPFVLDFEIGIYL